MNNYEINFFIWIVLFYVNLLMFYSTDKKIGRLDTDDLDEIEKIANWSDEERNALHYFHKNQFCCYLVRFDAWIICKDRCLHKLSTHI